MTKIYKVIKFYDIRLRMKLIWFSLIISSLSILWKGTDYRLIIVLLSCIIYIILESIENNGRRQINLGEINMENWEKDRIVASILLLTIFITIILTILIYFGRI